MDRITLRDVAVDCIVGILQRERVTPQRLVVDLDLELSLDAVGQSGDLALGVDYADVAEQVRWLASEGQFYLLESLALAVVRMLLLPPLPTEARAPLHGVRVALRKPDVLGGNPVVGVEMHRDGPGVDADPILSVPEMSLRRVPMGTPPIGALPLPGGGYLTVRRH